MQRTHLTVRTLVALVLLMLLTRPAAVMAHCDGMDGPVVKAAQQALASGDVDLVLVWVRQQDEDEIRRAFERTLQVRELGAGARELADTYFFETLVRVHRAGEGAPYTGLKPAGRDLGPAIPAADDSLESGDADALVALLTDELREGLIERFHHARQAREHATEDIEAGRRYVHAYVAFIHYVEAVHEATRANATGHFEEATHNPGEPRPGGR